MKKALVMLGGGWHPFEPCGRIIEECLKGSCDTVLSTDRDAFLNLKGFDLVVDYTQGGELTPAQEEALCAFVSNGGGFIGIHCASDSWCSNTRYMEMIGSHFIGHGPVTEFSVNITNRDHDITRRVGNYKITDEFYILEPKASFEVIATGIWQGKTHPMAYVRDYGSGHVFYMANGHDERAFNHPTFQKLLTRGVRWVTGQAEGRSIRCGIVGYGGSFNMGKCHADGIAAVDGLEVTAVCDLNPERTALAEKDFPGIRTYNSLDELASDPEVDLAVIVTPHNDHHPTAIKLLKAGKHVVCEKPFCITVEQATDMIETARANKVMLSTFHNRRWDDDFVTLRRLLRDGVIGDPFHIEVFFGGFHHPGYWWRSDKTISGGAFYDWGAHFTDWVLNLMPYKMESVYGLFHKRVWHDVSNEDHCQAIVKFEGGRTADIQQSAIAAVGKAKWRILGTQGGIEMVGDTIKVTSFKAGYPEQMTVPFIKEGTWGSYYENVADHLLTGARLTITPESARRVIAVLSLAEESSRTGLPVRIPYEE